MTAVDIQKSVIQKAKPVLKQSPGPIPNRRSPIRSTARLMVGGVPQTEAVDQPDQDKSEEDKDNNCGPGA